MKLPHPTTRVFRAVQRLGISASGTRAILTQARQGHWMAREVVRGAIQNRHRTRGWKNEMSTILTRQFMEMGE